MILYTIVIIITKMISTTSNVLEFFSNIANDPALLANGYALITKYLKESQ